MAPAFLFSYYDGIHMLPWLVVNCMPGSTRGTYAVLPAETMEPLETELVR